MSSDLDRFFSVLFHLLGDWRAGLEPVAWTMLGGLLLAGILFCVWSWRWILRDGLALSSRHFFAKRREIGRYLKDH
jgi:hypothetical protein